jgi:conjugal transfer pilus assembly protein TraI
MDGMNNFIRRLLHPARPAPAAAAVTPTAARLDIPRYPPVIQGIPVVAAADLLATQAELVQKLRYGIGCTPEFYRTWVLPVVDRYASFVHLLPASETHHHRGAGGLLHHGLEVAFWAGQASAGKVFAMDREPAVRRVHEPMWRLAAALAGLCHDLGKPISDLSVTDRDGTCTWSPMLETIADWATRHRLDSYFLHWRSTRHNRHQTTGLFVVNRVLGPAIIDMLIQANPEIMTALINAVGGENEGSVISQLVANADGASVEWDLKANRIDARATSLGVPIERYLLDAMARLIRDGTWQINTPGARLWMLGDSLYVVWPKGGEEIVAMLSADRVPGIPRHPDTLADLLIEHGYATPPQDTDCPRRYWRLAPAPLARDGKPVALTLLRLSSPRHVLSGPAPTPVALAGDAVVRAAIPTPGQSQGHPVGAPQAISRSLPVDSAAGGDAARQDEEDENGVGNIDFLDSLEKTDILPAVAIPESSPPCATDRIPAPTVPAVRPRPSPSPIEQAATRLSGQQPMTTSTVGLSTTSAPTDPRTVAEAWFQARRPGAGARLLLALAAAIRSGECTATAVLYLPNQPGNQIWVRVPDGLAGFGSDLEVQIAALWDDNLIAMDILKPHLRVRMIDGTRGVALHVAASAYLAALLPPGALVRSAPPATASGAPAAVPLPVSRGPAPPPIPAITPPAGPSATAARPRPSPSVVANALIAQVRAEQAVAGAGTVIRLTPAALSAAAELAGVPVQSVRRSLMSRPECRIMPDAGVEITLP